ncbi:MAG: N-acetyltransferase, partial [Bacteroidota bacterium]|nr:N-acetyltransferase [Bacteroidota bacterium]
MVIIRDAQDGDLPAILDIYNDAVINTTAVYSEEPHT